MNMIMFKMLTKEASDSNLIFLRHIRGNAPIFLAVQRSTSVDSYQSPDKEDSTPDIGHECLGVSDNDSDFSTFRASPAAAEQEIQSRTQEILPRAFVVSPAIVPPDGGRTGESAEIRTFSEVLRDKKKRLTINSQQLPSEKICKPHL